MWWPRTGAPNIDSACTGTTLRDFISGADLSRIPEELVMPYDQEPPAMVVCYGTPEGLVINSLWRISQHQFTGRKVLVTGASGFIGSHLCRGLVQRWR